MKLSTRQIVTGVVAGLATLVVWEAFIKPALFKKDGIDA